MAVDSVGAYVLAADPWFLEESVSAYYPWVDRIVVSYDGDGRSWTGTDLPVEDCLARLRKLDVDGKCDYVPGHFARLEHHPLDNDTHQRQVAMAEASRGVDWVLQLDTDEVVVDVPTLRDCLDEADRRGAGGLEYPARWLYARTPRGRFLERSSRWWGPRSNYPGPIAVRAGTGLRHCRQADVGLFRVDVRPRNTDPAHPRDAAVHRVVPVDAAILHYSWIRDLEWMQRKAGWSGHSDLYSEPEGLPRWRLAGHAPGRSLLGTPFSGRDDRMRLVRLPRARRFWVGEPE